MRAAVISIICTALLGACAATGRDVEVDLPMVIPDALYPELTSKVRGEPVQSRVLSLSKTITVDNKGNLGTLAYNDQQQLFSFRPDGLLRVQTTASFQGPAGSSNSVDQAVSLCGLVPVLGEASGLSNFMVYSLQSATRFRLSRLDVNTSSLCQPTPGMEFSIKFEAEVQRQAHGGIFRSNKQMTLTEQATCKVGPNLLPASDLNLSMRGQYAAVSCVYNSADPSTERKAEYAFLLASGIYVSLGEVTKWQTDKARFSSVQYQPE